MSTLPRRTRLLLALPFALTSAALAPSAASAAVTTTAITSTVPLYDQGSYDVPSTDPANARTVTGTSDGVAGDLVDLVCRQTPTLGVKLAGGTVVAGGAWSVTYGADKVAGRRCRMAVVPAGANPNSTDLTPFAGPVVYGGALQRYKYTTGANTGKEYDWYWESGRPAAFNDYLSIASCGLCDTKLRKDDGTLGLKYLWYDNAAAYRSHTAEGAARAYLKVDGTPAYFPTGTYNILTTGPTGVPALTVTATSDSATGDTTIVSDETPTTCGAFPPTAMNCAAFTSAHIAVKRTIVEDEGGLRVRITDEWRSTDGQPHAVDIDMDEFVQASAGNTGLLFPGDGDFGPAGAAGTTKTGFSGITTIGFKHNRTAPATIDAPTGSLTVRPAPSQALFITSSSGFLMRHLIAVPATGVATVKRVYVIAASAGGLDAATSRARDLIEGPSVTLDDMPASVTSPTLAVTGTAADAVGVASVSVNGGAAALAGSTYSRNLTLAPGVNAVTVVATDGAGNTATATGTVTYTPPVVTPPVVTLPGVLPPAVLPPVVTPAQGKPTIRKSGQAGARTLKGVTTVSLGQKVTCPTGKTTCTTTVSVKVGKAAAGSLRVSTKPGRATVLRLKLGKAAAKALKKNRRLVLKVTITARNGTQKATKTLTLTLRR